MEGKQKAEEFKKEFKALLLKYNAYLYCDIDGDTHGLITKMIVEVDKKDYLLTNTCDIDANDLK